MADDADNREFDETSETYEFSDILPAERVSKLRAAVKHSRQQLEAFRRNRKEAISQYVGKHYSDDGAPDKVPVNLLALAILIYLRSLASRTPQVMISTKVPELKPSAYSFELGLNHLLKEIKYRKTQRRVVLDALFSIGIAKVGMNSTDQVEINGVFHDVGQPYFDHIDLDDWVHDISAKAYEQVQYAGHKFRLPLEYVKENPAYTNTANLKASYKEPVEEATEDGVASISRGEERHTDSDEYRQYIDLWELWLPLENLIVTLPVAGGPPIRVEEWEGPERGPYHILSFSDVPGQIMPLAPVALWIDIHELANKLYNKLGRQAERQRDILGYTGEAADQAKRIGDGGDGDMIQMEQPGGAQEYKFGGIDQTTLAFVIHNRDLYSWLAGNLDTLGGLSPQAETLGQEELLVGNTSKMLDDMRDMAQDFNAGATEDLGSYVWHDPFWDPPIVKKIAGTDIEISTTFSPEERAENDFVEYNFSIDPYSTEYRSPAAKLQTMTHLVQNFVIPAAPAMAEQGIFPNWEGIMRVFAKYTDMSEIDEILTFGGEPMAQRPQTVNPGRPAVTQRTNVRINKPGRTRQGADFAHMQTLLGGGVQNSEAAAAVGP